MQSCDFTMKEKDVSKSKSITIIESIKQIFIDCGVKQLKWKHFLFM